MTTRRRAGWTIAVALAWCVRFVTLNGLPWLGDPPWLSWFDQSRYFASAVAFGRGDLSVASHWYPLTYSLFAAPLTWITPRDPFVLLDLALYLVTWRSFCIIAARLGVGIGLATGSFVLTTLIDAAVARAWVDPWTTTLSAALIWVMIDQTLRVIDSDDACIGARDALLLGAVLTAIPLVRPVDALVSLAGGAIVIFVLLRQAGSSIRVVGLGIVGGLGCVAAYAALHLAIYGAQATPYMIAAAQTGFVWSDLGWKAYVLLIHAKPWFPETQAVFERMPWIPIGVAGLIVAAVFGDVGKRRVLGLLALAALPVSAVMLTYADLQPPGLWRFGNIHYFKWVLPVFALGVILFVRHVRLPGRRRIGVAIVAVGCLSPLAIRIVPQAVGDATPARMLTFSGDVRRPWDEAYFAPVTIRDTGGVLTNINGFHQVPDSIGQRAIAVSRLFLAEPCRYDPGEPAATQPQRPNGRFVGKATLVGF